MVEMKYGTEMEVLRRLIALPSSWLHGKTLLLLKPLTDILDIFLICFIIKLKMLHNFLNFEILSLI